MSNKKFDYENFKYSDCCDELRQEIKKPNILICGGTGVGKSSLINSIFNLELAGVSKGEPGTRGVKRYTTPDSTVNLYDTEGYEIGSKEENRYYFDNIIGTIQKKKKEYPLQFEEHIHEVWYCINKKLLDIDIKIIKEVKRQLSGNGEDAPVMIIITKVDTMDETELNTLKAAIASELRGTAFFCYSTELSSEEYPEYVQKKEIIDWALDHLAESLQAGLIPSLKLSLAEMRKTIIVRKIPVYTTLAAGTVLGMGFVNVPFADSVPLMGIQVKMAMDILKTYGIDSSIKNLVTELVGAELVSYLGKTLAAQLFSLIPVIGNIGKAAVNVPVAATITALLGAAITLVCEQYLKVCIDHDGAENLPDFSEFFNKERLREAINEAQTDKSLGLQTIIDTTIKEAKSNE